MQDFKTVALYAARVAGTILEKHFPAHAERRLDSPEQWVAVEERRAERVLVKTIQGAFPTHAVLTEGSGWPSRRESPYAWIIDPLDGTINYAHGVPIFCISIALEEEGRIVLGVVYNPIRRDMFVAEAGGGSWLNGEPVRVSTLNDLSRALLATGFGYDIRDSREQDPAHFSALSRRAQGIRRTGAVALDLCYVASGRFDGFWERHLDPWDTAAGALIVAEAGGRVTDYRGEPFSIFGSELLASNGLIHETMQSVMACPGDLRKDPRAPITMQISYQSSDAFKMDYVRNLSKGGLFIQTTSPLPRGTPLKVVLPFASPHRVIEAEGVVTWVQSASTSDRGIPGMGVQFTALDPDDRAFIERLVASILSDPEAVGEPVAAPGASEHVERNPV
jgi:myo-inositol-1(or 4)-monophosphatase